MSEFLDELVAYTAKERDANLLSIEVKSLNRTVYFKPLGALSVEKFDQVLEGEKLDNIQGMIKILIVRALDQSGRPLFNQMDRLQLEKQVGPLVIAEIVRGMGTAESESQSIEDTEKNLETMPE